jgi:hypothetical protein
MQGLLDAERANGRALRKAVATVLRGPIESHAKALARSYQLRSVAEPVIEDAMRRGREASRVGLDGEFAEMRPQIIAAGVDPFTVPLALPTIAANDAAAARKHADELSAGFLKSATRLLAQDGGERRSAGLALPARHIDTLAATATAEPFNDERRLVERATADRYAGTSWLPAVVKIWDSTLDVRTCEICVRMNGQTRPWGISFTDPSGGSEREPAGVHRRCRCVPVNVFTVLYLGRDLEEQEAA